MSVGFLSTRKRHESHGAGEIVMWERVTKNGRLVLNDAAEEAACRGSSEVCPEHLLLAFVRDNEARNMASSHLSKPVAARILERLGVPLNDLFDELVAVLPASGAEKATSGVLSAEMQVLVRDAFAEADRIGNRYAGSEHMLLAMLRSDSAAKRFLSHFGVTWQDADAVLLRLQEG